jgi:hypothetical protein
MAAEALRRVETLIANLDALPETRAREGARELLEAVVELHGVALARMVASVACSDCGEALAEVFAADEQVSAVLLLHDLHPVEPERRAAAAIEAMASGLRVRGAEARLIEVRDGVACVLLAMPGASREEAAVVRREIEDALVEAAPDLEEVAVRIEIVAGGDRAPPMLGPLTAEAPG